MTQGATISVQNGKLQVPNNPIVPFIEGDGTGPDIWRASVRVFDAAVAKAYGGRRTIVWKEVLAGQRSYDATKNWLPDETVEAFNHYLVGIKGPLTTPVGGGMRSLNVALRQLLDLYVCLRPVRWFKGVPSPVKTPEKVDMVIFRENTEDIYAGIEWEAGSDGAKKILAFLKQEFPKSYERVRFPETSAIGIKPVSREGTERLIRSAIEYALANARKSLTIVHKGNIMKYTEGGFRAWGYALAEREFADRTYTWEQWGRTRDAGGEEAANAEQKKALDAAKTDFAAGVNERAKQAEQRTPAASEPVVDHSYFDSCAGARGEQVDEPSADRIPVDDVHLQVNRGRRFTYRAFPRRIVLCGIPQHTHVIAANERRARGAAEDLIGALAQGVSERNTIGRRCRRQHCGRH